MRVHLANFFILFFLFQSISAFEITIRTVDFVGNQRQKIDYKLTGLQGSDTITGVQNKFFQLAIPTEVKERLREYIENNTPFLYYLGKILKTKENGDTKTLADYSISGGAVLYCPDLTNIPYISEILRYDTPKRISIKIVYLEDPTDITQLTIHNLKTIADLKEIIRNQKNMTINEQQLVFGVNILNNENSLYSYALKDGDTVILQKLYQTDMLSKLKTSLDSLKKILKPLQVALSKLQFS